MEGVQGTAAPEPFTTAKPPYFAPKKYRETHSRTHSRNHPPQLSSAEDQMGSGKTSAAKHQSGSSTTPENQNKAFEGNFVVGRKPMATGRLSTINKYPLSDASPQSKTSSTLSVIERHPKEMQPNVNEKTHNEKHSRQNHTPQPFEGPPDQEHRRTRAAKLTAKELSNKPKKTRRMKNRAMNPAAKPWVPSRSPSRGSSSTTESSGYQVSVHPLVADALPGWPIFPHADERGSHDIFPLLQQSPVETTWIFCTDEYLTELRQLLHSVADLKANGYILENPPHHEVESKRRCTMCHKFIKKIFKKDYQKANWSISKGPSTQNALNKTLPTSVGTGNPSNPYLGADNKSGPVPKPILANGHPDADTPPPKNVCFFHPGHVDRKQRVWTCCGKRPPEAPCCGLPEHTPIDYAPGQLEAQWTYYHTPKHMVAQDSQACPVVAIDCEMGTTKDGESELIRVTLLEYFTGMALVDSLVNPNVEIDNYNTRYSGVSAAMMEAAKNQNACFFGRDSARRAVWEYIGPETIVVGHSAYNDLRAMRWIHGQIVDTFILEPKPVYDATGKNGNAGQPQSVEPTALAASVGDNRSKSDEPATQSEEVPRVNGEEAVAATKRQTPKPKLPKGSGPRALKTLARVKLGREIQSTDRVGHDSFEDALAARDLVHWAILDRRAKKVALENLS